MPDLLTFQQVGIILISDITGVPPPVKEDGIIIMETKAPKKPDRRQVRTKRRIREALMALVMEKPLEKITIKELAERADIDRKTFYLHYASINDVLAQMQQEMLERLEAVIERYDLFQPDFDALSFFRDINGVIGEDSAFIRRMLTLDRYSFFYNQLKDSVKTYLIEKYHDQLEQTTVSPVKLGLYIEYAASGVMAVYVQWIMHPEFDLDEVAQAVSEIAYGGGRVVLDAILHGSASSIYAKP